MNTLITPLKTGKGNNVKVGRDVVKKAVKALKPHATLPQTPAEGDKEIAYEYGALTPTERLGLISAAFQEMLEKREGAKALKIGRANLADLVTRLEACATELETTAQAAVTGLATILREILEPKPKAEPKGKGKKGEAKDAPEAVGV